MHKKQLSTMAMVVASVVGSSLSSCSDNEGKDDLTAPGNYHYQLNIPNANDELTVVLDSISSPVKSIGTCPDWATITVVDSMADGHPILRLSLKRTSPNTMNNAEVVVVSENNDKATLSLNQAFCLVDDDNSADDTFISDWEGLDSIMIYSNGRHQKVNLPWADVSMTTLPSSIRHDVKKKDGWEMAFCILNNEALDDCNYFALYNRYLGTLRIFHYVTNSSTTGSKYSFEVNMGSSGTKNKYPFYHSLEYAIPNNHTSVPNTVNLLGDGVSTPVTFKSFYTPYTAMSSTALSKGWTAFDMDMSAYCPTNNSWLSSGDEMSIWCKTELQQKISLDGTIAANISGKYSSAQQTVSASSGVSSLLSKAGSVIGDVQNSALAAIEQQVTGSSLDTYCYYIGAACNVASFAYDYILESKYKEEVIDSMPGKIEMSMTGDINLSGYISSLASNGVTPLTMSVKNFAKYNSHMGQGVWNLADDPVIYVVEDRIMGDARRISLTVNDDGTYGNNSVADYHLRMVSFFDPTSIKLNINTEVFPDVSDVKVICNYGVYPDVAGGHTSKYVNLLNMARPTMKIVKDGEKKTVYQSASSSNKTKYLNLSHTSFMSKQLGETADNCSVVKQTGTNYSYYGRKVMSEGKNFIISPQVYFPYNVTDKDSKIYNGEMPDFVVMVNVSFKSAGRTFIFSQRFLPKIVTISSTNLKTKYNELVDYAEKCKAGKEINHLQNQESVGVKHLNGDGSIQKTLDILKAVGNY